MALPRHRHADHAGADHDAGAADDADPDYDGSSLPGPIADGTPDSWGRAVIKMALGGKPLTDLDYLLESDDYLRSGAFRYFDGPGKDAKALAPPKGKDLHRFRGFSTWSRSSWKRGPSRTIRLTTARTARAWSPETCFATPSARWAGRGPK